MGMPLCQPASGRTALPPAAVCMLPPVRPASRPTNAPALSEPVPPRLLPSPSDVGQSQHFEMVFAAAKKAGWLVEGGPKVSHVGFGLVLGEDGKRFR